MHYWRKLGKYVEQMAADSMANNIKKTPSLSQISNFQKFAFLIS